MKKTREEIMADIARIVGRQLGVEIGVDEINGNAYLYDDLGLDSLDIADLASELEEMYDFSIDEDERDLIHDMTVNELISVVEKYLADAEV